MVKSVCSRIRVENLQDEDIRQKYMDMNTEEFQTIDNKQVQAIEGEWVVYRDAILETARECWSVYQARCSLAFWKEGCD